MKVPKQGQRRSGQGVAVPALGKPNDVVFDAPTNPWLQGKSGAPSSRVDTTMSRRMQTTYGEDEETWTPGQEGLLTRLVHEIVQESCLRAWPLQEAEGGSGTIDSIVHLGLDACGLIPGAGEICDVANVVLYARKGEWLNAVLSLISVIPEVGDLIGKGGKLALWFEKVAPRTAGAIAKHGPDVAKAIRTLKTMIRSNRQAIDSLLDDAESSSFLAQYVPEMRQALDAFAGKAKLAQTVGEVATVGAVAGYTLPLGGDAENPKSRKSRRTKRKNREVKQRAKS